MTALPQADPIRWSEIDRDVVAATFPARPASVPLARAWVGLMMTMYDRDEDGDTARLLVGELAARAVRQGRGDEFGVRLDFAAGFEASVHDRSAAGARRDSAPPTTPPTTQPTTQQVAQQVAQQMAQPDPGLAVLAVLADSWGTSASPDGTSVWFRLSA